MSQILTAIVAFLVFSLAAHADFNAEIFETGSNKTKKIYSFSNQVVDKDGISEVTTVYKDTEGKVVVEEKAWLKKTDLVKMEYKQNQMNQTAAIEVKNGKVVFTKTVEGKIKTSDESLKMPLVISSSFSRFVSENWSKIMSGEKINFRFGSWERMETVGFEVFKIGEGKIGDQPVVEVKMKAANFIIAAIVDPLIFKFASDGSKIIEMSGRVAPKKLSGSNWKDLDADVVYKHL